MLETLDLCDLRICCACTNVIRHVCEQTASASVLLSFSIVTSDGAARRLRGLYKIRSSQKHLVPPSRPPLKLHQIPVTESEEVSVFALQHRRCHEGDQDFGLCHSSSRVFMPYLPAALHRHLCLRRLTAMICESGTCRDRARFSLRIGVAVPDEALRRRCPNQAGVNLSSDSGVNSR